MPAVVNCAIIQSFIGEIDREGCALRGSIKQYPSVLPLLIYVCRHATGA
jgi:hypothetical protein